MEERAQESNLLIILKMLEEEIITHERKYGKICPIHKKWGRDDV